MYRVFLGAPSKVDLGKDPSSYQWRTISSKSPMKSVKQNKSLRQSRSIMLPPSTLEAASRRISLLYENAIFDETAYDENVSYVDPVTKVDSDSATMYTWPPTVDVSRPRRVDDTLPSFMLDDASKSDLKFYTSSRLYETQDIQDTQSYEYSDASSIVGFPSFHFSLHSLTSLQSLRSSSSKGSRKVAVLMAVLEVEGPNTICVKNGRDTGKEVSILVVILGDEEGVCKLTAWREIADAWGGAGDTTGVKRGDILYIENATATWDSTTSPTLSASPFLKSKMEICYRTMPYTHEDNRLRPNLRLGEIDGSVRKVAAVVRWFEGMAGLSLIGGVP